MGLGLRRRAHLTKVLDEAVVRVRGLRRKKRREKERVSHYCKQYGVQTKPNAKASTVLSKKEPNRHTKNK